MRIYLTGLPASGKSTSGRVLADHFNIPFIDLDEEIEKRGRSIAELFAESEEEFRRVEKEELSTIISQSKNPSFCLSLGGGTLMDLENLKLVRNTGVLLFIDTPQDDILNRLAEEKKNNIRPMFRDQNSEQMEAQLKKIWRLRKANYLQSHIITGVQDHINPELLTKRVELFTKFG